MAENSRPCHGTGRVSNDERRAMLFYAECQHAGLHVYHYIMCSVLVAFQNSIKNDYPPCFTRLQALIDLYCPEVGAKVDEVNKLLVDDEGDGFGFLTHEVYHSNAPHLRVELGKMVKDWLQCTDEQEFCCQLIPSETARRSMTQFNKMVSLIEGFATAVADEMWPSKSFMNTEFGRFCHDRTGLPAITLGQWVRLMAISGLVHGHTFSMSRLFFTYSDSDDGKVLFDEGDFRKLAVVAGTIVGVQDGHEVFPDPELTSAPGLKLVLAHHADRLRRVQREAPGHFEALLKQRHLSLDYMWMFADYFPSDKSHQPTIATYI